MINKKRFRNGYTIFEGLVASVIMVIIGGIVTQVLFSTQKNTFYVQGTNILKDLTQLGFFRLGRNISTLRTIVGRIPSEASPTLSTDYLNRMTIPSSFKLGNETYFPLGISSRVLPEVDSTNSFSPENDQPLSTSVKIIFDQQAVGNSLLIGVNQDTVTYSWGTGTPPPNKKIIDLLQIHYYFLARNNLKNKAGNNNLIIADWQSAYYADYNQIKQVESNMTSGEKTAFYNYLLTAKSNLPAGKNTPIAGAWDFTQKAGSSTGSNRFYTFTGGTLTSIPQTNTTYKIQFYKFENPFRLPNRNNTDYTIARNNTNTEKGRKAPLFAAASASGDGFPHGFEVMISGQQKGRKVYIRSVLQALGYARDSYYEADTVFQCNDF